jgi:hypothetical protein
MVTAGRPHYGRLVDMDFEQARRALDEHLLLMLQVARKAAPKMSPGGTLLFMGGTGGHRPGIGHGIVSTVTAALPALTANWRSSSRPSESTSSPPASSTHGCRQRSSAMSSKTAAISFAPRFPSGASSPGRRRRARRTHHDQHRPHWRDLRHRRRAAARRRLAVAEANQFERWVFRVTA